MLAHRASEGAGLCHWPDDHAELKLCTVVVGQLVKGQGSASYRALSIRLPNKPLGHLLPYVNIVPWMNPQKTQAMTRLLSIPT